MTMSVRGHSLFMPGMQPIKERTVRESDPVFLDVSDRVKPRFFERAPVGGLSGAV